MGGCQCNFTMLIGLEIQLFDGVQQLCEKQHSWTLCLWMLLCIDIPSSPHCLVWKEFGLSFQKRKAQFRRTKCHPVWESGSAGLRACISIPKGALLVGSMMLTEIFIWLVYATQRPRNTANHQISFSLLTVPSFCLQYEKKKKLGHEKKKKQVLSDWW